MKSVGAAVLVASAIAKDVKLTWKDCGDATTHAKITSFTPGSITLGQKATMTGTGDLDEDITGATFDMETKYALGTLSCAGPADTSKVCKLPMGAGAITFDAMTFPIKKGTVSVSVDMDLSSHVPGSFMKTTTKATGKTSTGDKLFCMEISTAPAEEELDVHPERAAMIKEIENTPGVLWKAAAHPRFAAQAPGASKDMNGVKGDQKAIIEDLVKKGEIELLLTDSNAALPDNFDSATNWPQCEKIINDIRDQSNCGCCWAFAGAEAASDRMCISTNATIMVPLSAQDVCFNGGGLMSHGCNGGQISAPWSYMKKGGWFGEGKGAVTGGQYQGSGPFGKGLCSDFSMPHCHHHGPQGKDPFPAENAPGCPSQTTPAGPTKCDADAAAPHNTFASDKYSFKGTVVTAMGEAGIQQAIMAGGPMEVAFTVYADFENYESGIYHHVTGDMAGGHAVKMVGWGVDAGVKYWKIANSWNPYWGEKGYFRMRRGTNEGGVENQAVGSSPDAKWSKAADEAIVV